MSGGSIDPGRQLRRLQAGLKRLTANPFQAPRLRLVRTWEEFQRLPFTARPDLVADQAAHPPFGSNLSRPPAEYVYAHKEAGLRWVDTAGGWRWQVEVWAGHALPAAGITARDRVLVVDGGVGGRAATAALEAIGALAMPLPFATAADVLDLAPTAAILAAPAARAIATMAAEADVPLAAGAVRSLLVTGAGAAADPELGSAFGASVLPQAGLLEAGPFGFGCRAGNLHLNQAEFLVEVTQDGGEGPVGELVLTNLGRWDSPAVRYRTGLGATIATSPCSCGSRFMWVEGGLRPARD